MRDRVEVSVRQPDGTTLPERLTVIDWEQPGEQRLPARLPVLGSLRPLPAARRPRRVRQRHPAGLHRAEGLAPQPQARLRRQPQRLPRHHPAPLHPQRVHHPLQRRGDQGRDDHLGLGVLLGVEEDQLRGRGGVGLAGDRHPGHVHQGPPARPARELRRLPGPARRVRQAARPQPPVPRRQQRPGPDGGAARRPAGGAGQARRLLAHPGLGQDDVDALLLPEGAAQACPGTGPSSSSPTARTWTTRRTRSSSGRGSSPRSTSGPPASAHLRQLLSEDHRYVFTLIQKFRTEQGEIHPVLSERDDVIVITDEAHRTQYDILALNMRNALPNAGLPRLHRNAADRGRGADQARSSATTSRSTTSLPRSPTTPRSRSTTRTGSRSCRSPTRPSATT